MFFKPYFVLSFLGAGLVHATALRRSNAIQVHLSTPSSSIRSSNDLKLMATVGNTGSESVKILKYGSILDNKLPTQAFTVTKDGNSVPFTGIKVSVSMAHTDDSSFTVIPPGQNVTVIHDVTSIYDFASVGTGKFTFEPNTQFVIAAGSNDQEKNAILTKTNRFAHVKAAASNSVKVDITGTFANKGSNVLDSRAFNNCTDNPDKRTVIDLSYAEAKMLASNGSSYITAEGNNTLFTEYFGTTPTADVIAVLDGVANENDTARGINCDDLYGACTEAGLIAYTIIATTDIFLCDIFFEEAVAASTLCNGTTVDDRIVRGGTVLHELTHAIGATVDITYGCQADQGLTPPEMVSNADNFNCFTTQVYAATQC